MSPFDPEEFEKEIIPKEGHPIVATIYEDNLRALAAIEYRVGDIVEWRGMLKFRMGEGDQEQDGKWQGRIVKSDGDTLTVDLFDEGITETLSIERDKPIKIDVYTLQSPFGESRDQDIEASIMDGEDARALAIQAMGYTDLQGQLRASFLLGLTQQKLWKACVTQIKKKYEKEMIEAVDKLCKWGTVEPSKEAVKDIIAKVLIAHDIPPYPNLIEGIYANPFQERAYGPDVDLNRPSGPDR